MWDKKTDKTLNKISLQQKYDIVCKLQEGVKRKDLLIVCKLKTYDFCLKIVTFNRSILLTNFSKPILLKLTIVCCKRYELQSDWSQELFDLIFNLEKHIYENRSKRLFQSLITDFFK